MISIKKVLSLLIITALMSGYLAALPNSAAAAVSADTGFNPDANSYVSSIALQPDGKILVGGGFTNIAGAARNRIARLNADYATVQNLTLSADSKTLTWARSGSGPEVYGVTFESSADNNTWTYPGTANRIAGGWQLAGLSLPKGLIYIRARGRASGGYFNGSTSIIESVGLFDTKPPTVIQGLTTQSNGKYVKGVINLKANVTDNVGITNVKYFRDATSNLIGSSAVSPYSVNWNTATAVNGNHNVYTYAYDAATNIAHATTLLRVDNYKPRTSAPKKARVKKGRRVRLYYKVRDPYTGGYAYVKIVIKKGRKKVTKKLGWQRIKKGSTYPLKHYNYLAKLAKGKYKFYVYAKDKAGNTQYKVSSNYLTVY